MKNILAVTLFYIFSMGAVAEAARNGVQFSSGGDLSYIHYGDNYRWAAGASIGFQESDSELNDSGLGWDTDQLDVGVFARKNFKIADKTYMGLGIWGQFGWGDGTLKYEGRTYLEADVESFSVSPYFILDYHLSNNFILNAGAEIVQFKFTDYEIEDVEVLNTDSVEYFKPFLSLTYLF